MKLKTSYTISSLWIQQIQFNNYNWNIYVMYNDVAISIVNQLSKKAIYIGNIFIVRPW